MKFKTGKLGQLEEIILLSLLVLGGESYAREISNIIREQWSIKIHLPVLHRSLDQLVNKGYVTVRLTDERQMGTSRSSKMFIIEYSGRLVLTESFNGKLDLYQKVIEQINSLKC